MPFKYEPEFNGVDNQGNDFYFPLALGSVSAVLDKAISVNEIINSGAQLNDHGKKLTPYNFKIAFIGSDVLNTQNTGIPTIEDGEIMWEFFITYGEEFTFVHPSLGAIRGRLKNLSRSEKDEVDSLTFDCTFYEEDAIPNPVQQVDIIAEAELGFVQSIGEQGDAIKKKLVDAYGTAGADLVALELDQDKSILDQVSNFPTNVRRWAANVDEQLNTLGALATEVQNPANSLIAVTSFASDVPGRMLGTITKTAERYKLLYEDLKDFPSKFTSSLAQALSDLDSAFTGSESYTSIKAMNAQTLALGVAQSYELDQEKRVKLKKYESSETFDVDGNLDRNIENPGDVQNLIQIELSLFSVRSYIQDAINLLRVDSDVGGLKTTAEALLFHVAKTKTEIDKIRTIEVKSAMPLQIALLINGYDYKTAERVLTLNDIKKPTFTQGEVKIYA